MDVCDDLQNAEEQSPLFCICEAAEQVRDMPGFSRLVDYICKQKLNSNICSKSVAVIQKTRCW